jgi:hypothetical protein
VALLLGLFLLLQVTGNPIVSPPPRSAPETAPAPSTRSGGTTVNVTIPPPDPQLVAQSAQDAAPYAVGGGLIPVVQGLSDALSSLVNLEPWSQTPKDMTTGNPDVQHVNGLLRNVAIAGLVLVLAWAGLIAVGGPIFGADPLVVMELIPRVLFCFGLAIFSLSLLERSIDLSNAVTGAIGSQDLSGFFVTDTSAPAELPPFGTLASLAGPLVSLIVGLVYLLAALATLGWLWMRDVLLGILVAVAPLFLLLLAIPRLEHFGRRWAVLYGAALISNIPIVVALELGKPFIDLAHGASSLLQLLLRIGVLLLIPTLFHLFGHAGPNGPSLLGLALLARLGRGAMTGMARGGPAGAVIGATAAAATAAVERPGPGMAATWKSQRWAPALAPSARTRAALPAPRSD